MADPSRPLVWASRISSWAVDGIPEIAAGDDLAAIAREPLLRAGGLRPWDVVVVTHKVVSKAEGRLYSLEEFTPGELANRLAAELDQDPRMVEAVLAESTRVVRAEQGVLVTETPQGLVCANSGVDRSNVGGGEMIACLPKAPDLSAARLRDAWLSLVPEAYLGVIISDTFGRPFREGAVNVAIGLSGMPAISDHRGLTDQLGYELHASTIGSADEIASLGELVMGKIDARPLAVVRGLRWSGPDQGSAPLLRAAARDLFRR